MQACRWTADGVLPDIMEKLDLMVSDEIKNGLDTNILGNRIYCYSKTSSTNDIATKLAQDGASEGTIVVAENQTKGRGRRERRWIAPMGTSILMSIILRPQINITEASILTLMAASAVAVSIKYVTGITAKIKWPNDLVIDKKKVSGILTEARTQGKKISYVVLGIGVTVNIPENRFPDEIRDFATSLSMEKGETVSRIILLQEILRQLERRYLSLMNRENYELMQEWKNLSSTIGSRVKVVLPKRIFHGLAVDFDQTGALLVRLDENQVKRFTAERVMHLYHI
ncbi:biotin--[acetyl-CoA-carboxylase] ligase [Candidatus Poribacteria bacterium]|nr:biotin--[acetyl-CoA-carboxylase] ligase [Candidatus Poribacteria bacterium]